MLRSYQVAKFGEPLAMSEAPLPVPKGAEVLVKVDACGVCHSDIHIWDGYWDLGNDKKIIAANGGKLLPLTMGHEIIGEVVAMGPDAKGCKIGDKRLVFPWIGCGQCVPCKRGDEHICGGAARAIGIFVHGGFASHVLVEHSRALVEYEPLPADLACTYACSGVTAYSALKKIGRLNEGENLLIMGAGGVGLNGIRLAKSVNGVAPIVADIDPGKRQAALDAGAKEVIDPRADGALRSLIKATGGVMGAVDFVGAPSSFDFAQGALGKGGHLVVVGLFGGATQLSLPLFVMRGIRFSSSYVGSLQELKEMVEIARREKLPPMPVHARPLAEATAALADLKAGKVVGRTVLHP